MGTQTYSDDYHEYSVAKLMELSKDFPIIEIPLKQLISNLEDKCWSDEKNDPERKLPNFSPKDVIELKGKDPKYDHHYVRMLAVDFSYPIILRENNIIVDGMHRLLKAYLEGKEAIKAVIFEELPTEAIVK